MYLCALDAKAMLDKREAILIRDYTAALNLARFARQDKLLDVATGSGRMLTEIVKRGHSVVSVDVDAQALDRARQRLGDLADRPTLLRMDAHHLDFSDGSFAAATLANAIHEITAPIEVLGEIARVLTDDGKLLVVEFNAAGYDLMDLHHQMEGKAKHPRGEMSTLEIDSYLRSEFECVESRMFHMTWAWVGRWKRRARR